MLRQSIRNQALISNKSEMTQSSNRSIQSDQPNLSPYKHHINVLDVDETLLTQRIRHDSITYPYNLRQKIRQTLPMSNVNELNFGLKDVTIGEEHRSYLVVFRPFLMEFIDATRLSSHFIIYSLADPSNIIPQLILIEMYYNFCHQLTNLQTISHPSELSLFKFDYIITALQNEHKKTYQKSLNIMLKLIGDVPHIDRVVIVDDMASSVWHSVIPERIRKKKCDIYALHAPAFMISAPANTYYAGNFAWNKHQRAQDKYLRSVIDFVKDPSEFPINYINASLLWISNQQMMQFLKYKCWISNIVQNGGCVSYEEMI